jgi:hypothetical protein
MLLRFVCAEIDEDSQVVAGIFTAAFKLRRSGSLPDYEHDVLYEVMEWFNENLERPLRFSRSARRSSPNRAICWFKSTAREHLEKVREMAAVLENNAVLIWMIKTDKPGYVVYEDAFQIAAEPFADTRRVFRL